MTTRQIHKIHTANLQVDFEGIEEGLGLQDSLALLFYEKIQPALEKAFDRLGPTNETLVLDLLEVDCGQILYENWEEILTQRILIQLEEKLKQPQKKEIKMVAQVIKAEEVFFHFLQKGLFPWNSPFSSPKDLEDSLEIDIPFLKNLQTILPKSQAYQLRLLRSFSPSFTSKIIDVWFRNANPKIPNLFNFLKSQNNPEIQKELFQVFLISFSLHNPPSLRSFLEILIQQLSTENLSNLAEYMGRERFIEKDLRQALITVFSKTSDADFKRRTFILWEKIKLINPRITENLLKDFPGLKFQPLSKQDKSNRKSAKNDPHFERKKTLEENDDKFSINTEDFPFSEEIYIENAGLILLHPFLTGLFNNLKLTEDEKFKTDNNRSLATRVLQFLVYGENDHSENFYPLNKILCGMGVSQVLVEEMEISLEFKNECEELLQAVIRHWSVLKNTSVAGLRETFLQRHGKISHVEKGWKLQVERKTVDVLLAKLPWGLGIIKLPWMKEMLFIEWD